MEQIDSRAERHSQVLPFLGRVFEVSDHSDPELAPRVRRAGRDCVCLAQQLGADVLAAEQSPCSVFGVLEQPNPVTCSPSLVQLFSDSRSSGGGKRSDAALVLVGPRSGGAALQ